jgi:hypothetical protein
MPIINAIGSKYIPLEKPSLSAITIQPYFLIIRITNNAESEVTVYYELDNINPSSKFVVIGPLGNANITLVNLEEDRLYTLYARASGASGYSDVTIFQQKTPRDVLYDFSSFTFTSAGLNSRTGPNLDQCKTAYSFAPWVQNLLYFNVVKDGYQRWTVPMNGAYRITVAGASGGSSSGPGNGGFGARMEGIFTFTKGQILTIVVGQQGGQSDFFNSAGNGGGGSFIFNSITDFSTSTVLIAAGGGGGFAGSTGRTLNTAASLTMAGNDASNGTEDNYGFGGLGGDGGAGGIGLGGHGGAGINTNGIQPESGSGFDLPQAISLDAIGGYNNYFTFGGFGGGGGYNGGGGGGGGYSGGGGGNWPNGRNSGGGGSFNLGENQVNTILSSGGNGYVVIEKL